LRLAEDSPALVTVREVWLPSSSYRYVVVMSHASVDDFVQPLSKYAYLVSLLTVCPCDGGADTVSRLPTLS
jgi:hypothetical protein